MASFYGKMKKTASKLVRKFGAKVTIERTIQGEYDPGTGSCASETKLEWTADAVRTAITEVYLGGATSDGIMTDGTRIETGDMMILVALEGQEHIPQISDKVTFSNGETWIITSDMPIQPAAVTVLYKGVIRKG